jgi:HPt (histidine-containing phosphotransfer) domain-containing protein
MPDKKQDTQQKLHQLRQQYAEKLPGRIRGLEQQWLALELDPQTAQYENLIREFHSLAGSGTSFGFPQITKLSREIEEILLQLKFADDQDSKKVKSEINTRLSELKHAATEKPD